MIRLGIVGCNYGRAVQLPAFRADSRCRVVALAGADAARTAELARQSGIPEAFGDWARMIERPDIDAVAIAVPPRLQPEIAVAALKNGKPVFVEKPMASDLEGAALMLRQAGAIPTAMDFNFTEVMAFRKAKALIDSGAIGRLRHVAVTWHVENASTRLRLKNWKTSANDGGGALGNFVSHSLHYLEWFGGPLAGLSARLSGLPDDPTFETNAVLSLAFASGAAGSLSMSSAAFAGSGHRLEFYGNDGALALANPTTDYMRGFTLGHARRPDALLTPVAIEPDPLDGQFPGDGRIAPVSRLASRFLDAIESKTAASPGFAEGYRVQALLDTVRRSHDQGRSLDAKPGETAMSGRRILVTGGSGFIGSALVKALVKDGNAVRVLDDNSRGAPRRLDDVKNDIEFIGGDVRDAATVERAVRGMEEVHHLAFVNGTEFFYSAPELVLDVGVKGMINVIDACRAAGVRNLVLASSSEVYQTPPTVPTDERAPLLVPDPTNPRYSYGGGKIISELMAINYGRKLFDRVLIFRPHNVYGPDMGFEHVVPQFALRLKKAAAQCPTGKVPFEIQGDGRQTRSFCHVDDLVAGVMVMRAKGEHLGIYHIGTLEEVTIGDVARRIAAIAGREIELVTRPAPAGGTDRRCPDIGKLASLGYAPRVTLEAGLRPTREWYWANERLAPRA